VGKWKDENVAAPKSWKVAVDKESHELTDSQLPLYKLTGESAGRQTWHYDKSKAEDVSEIKFNGAKNPNSGDKLFRQTMLNRWKGSKPSTEKPTTAREAAKKGYSFFQMIQCEDGHWAGDYGGPMFLMPGLVCVLYLTKAPFPAGRREGMIHYLRNHQQVDGGWGTHIECASTMFGTVLNYVALRLLGESAEASHMIEARDFMHRYGGALFAPSWAKFWLAVLGVYDWEGINSVPAEMWFLPRWFPFHPGKLWCHCRMVYLPMGYLYCSRYTPDVSKDPLLLALRQELYTQPYESIEWNNYRQTCADIDEYSPLNPIMKIAQDALALYERYYAYFPWLVTLRKQAIQYSIEYIDAEDIQTNFIDIGPVNKSLNMLSVYVANGCDPLNPKFIKHLGRVEDYLWVAEDGMKMQGYNGSQCWDTAFATQAILELEEEENVIEAYRKSLLQSYSYFNRTQIKEDEDNREYYYRHISKGGWPFSTAAHGWPISDCTSEGLKAVLAIHRVPELKATLHDNSGIIPVERLHDACDVLLSYQNVDGGWATYENNRGYGWYELLNPSEVFGDIMIDYSYVECSSATITALKAFAYECPGYRTDDINEAITRGGQFLRSIQRTDGSWYGSWGNCFTYGTWFGVEGLIAASVNANGTGNGTKEDIVANKKAIELAVQFVLSQQNTNGGWGENYLACVNKVYPKDGTGVHLGEGGSGVVQTAWAILTLISSEINTLEVKQATDRGVQFLMAKQVSFPFYMLLSSYLLLIC